MKTKKCKYCERVLSEISFVKNKSGTRGPKCHGCRYKQRSFDYKLRNNQKKGGYVISKDEYEMILMQQGGHCAICKKTDELCVDHDHKTGIVRGILCKKHNLGIGLLDDSPEILRAAANYIQPIA